MRGAKEDIRVGIVIPAYNPVPEVLVVLLQRIVSACQGLDYRILIVDDGSRPAVRLPEEFPGVELLRHPENRGKGAALRSGFAHFSSSQPVDVIVTLDADLQHPPEFIPRFLAIYRRRRAPLVLGYRRRILGVMPFHRILSNMLTSLIISLLTGRLVRDSQCGYRLIDRRLLAEIPLHETGFHLESELVIRTGWRKHPIAHVPIPTIYSNQKSSIKNIPDTLNFVGLVFLLMKERIFKGCTNRFDRKWSPNG